MSGPGLWLRLAVRELRDGRRGLAAFVACLALGVAAVSGVSGLAVSLESGMTRDAARILGGDVQARRTHVPASAEELALFRSWGQVSCTTRMRAMAGPADRPPDRAVLVELKAVDKAYPLYGKLELAPAAELSDALALRDGRYGAVADPAFLDREGLKPGDAVRLGEATLRLAGAIVREPDRAASLYGLGPRLTISLDALPATGLARPGSVVQYVYAIRLPDGADPRGFKRALEEQFPQGGWLVTDLSSSQAGLRRTIDNLALYLQLVSLAALLLGGVGAAGAVRGYLASKTASMAAMKSLGLTRRGLTGLYLLQCLGLALAGVAVGAAAGLAGASAAAAFLSGRLGLPADIGLHPAAALPAAAYGLLAALAFSLPPVSAAAAVSPARLFRGYADPVPLRPSKGALAVSGLALAALLGLAVVLAPERLAAWGFAVGAPACALVLYGLGRAVRKAAAHGPRLRDPRLGQAVANLHRPGSAAGAVISSLGFGLTALVVVTLAAGNVQERIRSRLPAVAPAYFFLDVPGGRIEEFRALALSTPGVERVESSPSLRGRIVRIAGVPAEEAGVAPDYQWAIRSERSLSFAAQRPAAARIIAGEWWPPDYRGPPRVCLDADMAREGFRIGVGDTLTVNVLGRPVTAEVACLQQIDWSSLALNHAIVFAPGVLDSAPHSYLATAYARDRAAEEALFQAVSRRFPSVAAVYVKDVLRELAGLADQAGLAVRAAAGFVLLAGMLVLAGAVRADLERRRTEAVLFKVLGATRRDVLLSLAVEFGLLGAAAAAAAACLGTAGAWLFVVHVLGAEWSMDWGALLAVLGGGVGAAVLLGLMGVRRALSGQAWPVLRND